MATTGIANLTAQHPTGNAAFCSRHERVLEWSLVPTVNSLTQVPHRTTSARR
jgi:hypothetical protein